MIPHQKTFRSLRSGWPLALLCVLAASRWLLEGAHPEVQTTALTEASGCFLATGFVAAFSWVSRKRRDRLVASTDYTSPMPQIARLAGGALALTGPALAAAVSPHVMHADDATLALALTPCVIAVGGRAFHNDDEGDELTARLWPGLAAIAGLLLLLPQPVFSSWRFALALMLLPVVTGMGAVCADWHAISGSDPSSAHKAVFGMAPVLATAGLLYAGLAAIGSHGRDVKQISAFAAGLDGCLMFLSLLSLQRLGASRWGAQFLLVPLLTLVEGAALLRPVLDVRSWIAFAVLAVSALYQLLLR